MNAHFLDGVASYVQTYNTPMHQESVIQNLAVYAQDAYTIQRLTLNVGARFENFKGWNPAQGAAGGAFSGARQFSQVDDIPNINMRDAASRRQLRRVRQRPDCLEGQLQPLRAPGRVPFSGNAESECAERRFPQLDGHATRTGSLRPMS